MKTFYTVLIALLAMPVMQAQNPNWSEHVAPIIYRNCTKCHNDNGIAGFSLLDYNVVKAYKYSIKHEVEEGSMPPWPPDVNYRSFAHERTLSAQEKATIIEWIESGTPEGDPSLAPEKPVYTSSVTLTSPDMALKMPVYTVNTSTDLYRCFVLPTNLLQSKNITDIEVVPGNRNIVHHVLVFQDTAQTCVTLDNNDPQPGYTNFGGVGSNTAQMIAAWVPGDNNAFHFPAGMGISLLKNAYVVIQVHYPQGISNGTDSTEVRFKFSSQSVRQVGIAPALNHSSSLTNGPLFIPKNTTKTFYAQYTVPLDASLLFAGPHMHLIGRRIKSWAVTPTHDTIPLIKIDNWDFHWQGMYNFKNLVKIPSGSILYSEAFYDNTVNNPEQPNNPPKDVALGESTTDEMMLIYFGYAWYRPGDENISQETSVREIPLHGIVNTPQLYDPYPNPVKGITNIDFYLPSEANVSFVLTDISGREVYNSNVLYASGINHAEVNTASYPAGYYTLSMTVDGVVKSRKLLVE